MLLAMPGVSTNARSAAAPAVAAAAVAEAAAVAAGVGSVASRHGTSRPHMSVKPAAGGRLGVAAGRLRLVAVEAVVPVQ